MAFVDVGLSITAINNASNTIRGVGNDVKRLGENAQVASNRLKAIQVVIAGILIAKVQEYGKALLVAVAAQQALEFRLASFAGGATAAKQVWADLNKSVQATPFGIEEVGQAWLRLRAVMGNNEQATATIQAIVSAVSAMGGKQENVDNLSEAFERMTAVGIASAREFKTILTQTGITLEELAAGSGKSTSRFQAELKKGFIGSQEFIDDFIAASKKKFGDYAGLLSNTVAGALGGLKNTQNEVLGNLMSRTDLTARFTAILQNLTTRLRDFVNSIDQGKIDALFAFFSNLEPLVTKIVTALYNIAVALSSVFSVAANIIGSLPQEAVNAGILGYFFFGRWGKAEPIIAGILGVAMAGERMGAMAQILKGLAVTVQSFATLFVMFGKVVGGILAEVINLIGHTAIVWNDFVHGRFAKVAEDYRNMASDMFSDTPKKVMDGLASDAAAWSQQMKAIFDKGFQGSDQGGIFEKNKKQIDAILAALKKLGDTHFTTQTPGVVIPQTVLDELRKARDFANSTALLVDSTKDKIAEMNFASGGNPLGAALAQLTQQGDAFAKTVESSKQKFDALLMPTAAARQALADLVVTQKSFNDAVEAAKQKTRDLYAIETQRLTLQAQLTQSQNAYALAQLKIANENGALANVFAGSEAGQAVLATMQQRQQYTENLIQLETQLRDLDIEIRNIQGDPARMALLQATQDSITKLRDGTQQALANLSTEGTMQRKLWQDLGSTIQSDLSDGISGLINGTMTLGDVARKVFSDMISMAIKYLVQLAFIQAMSHFSNGGAMPGSVVTFANGGLPQFGGNVKPFANGDLVTGPTLFGLAGEAGTEAIMPLTRIGGKLGVQSTGESGSDHYHLTIQAQDTQTGLEFVYKHITAIDTALQQQKRLNRKAK